MVKDNGILEYQGEGGGLRLLLKNIEDFTPNGSDLPNFSNYFVFKIIISGHLQFSPAFSESMQRDVSIPKAVLRNLYSLTNR